MIKNLKNPLDLVICLKLLNVISLSDEESEQRIHSILKTHLGHQYEEREAEAVQVLSTLSDEEKVNRTKASFSQLQEEEESIKKEILLMLEEIIFADEPTASLDDAGNDEEDEASAEYEWQQHQQLRQRQHADRRRSRHQR